MMGIQAMLTATKKMTKVLPTMRSSVSEGLALTLVQMSIVKMVEDELKIEVREDIRAAIITASIRPRAPVLYISVNTLLPSHCLSKKAWHHVKSIFGFSPRGMRSRTSLT